MPMAALVHISDLHIAQLGQKSLNARRQCWKRWLHLNGLLGHSADSLMDLDEFFDRFRQGEPTVQLIVTGDLTSMGNPHEFDIANQYLSRTLRGPLGDRIGLEVPDWGKRAIPGNHDHWAGYPIPVGPPTHALPKYFPPLPQIQPVLPLGKGRHLRLLRIDTDADVNPSERFHAFGSFVSQLHSLGAMLSPLGPNDNEIRVLCLHHSPTYLGSYLEITAASRIELYKFILQNRVAVLLCGHIHRPPWVALFPVNRAGRPPLDVVEACCGTTTQIDPSIGREDELEGLVDSPWENSLFVHRLFEWGGEIHWEAELYLEGRAGFVRADRLRNDIPAVTRFKVWPWPPR